MQEKIWLSPPHMSGEEQKYIQLAFDENYIAPAGSNLIGFEKELGEYLGIPHVLALTSGTAAIHLALITLGIKAGDEVLAPSFTFAACVNPIVYQGAIPIFVDSDSESWNMSPELLEKAIVDRIGKGKKPKAIIVVHLYGMPAKMKPIREIADKYEIPIIEDAAEALGSEYQDQRCGTLGDISIISFNGNKIITSSGGGALISRNREWIQKARFLATQAKDDFPYYHHTHIGYNYRMSNVVAGIGRGQLEVIENRVKKRRANFDFYLSQLGKFEGISFLRQRPRAYSNYWLTTILVDPEKTNGVSGEDIRWALDAENIESRHLWKPMHMQPVFEKSPAYVDGTSEKLFNIGLCLPSGSSLIDEQKERVVSTIVKTLNG
ncbi:MAG: aminotransferase class I/II-fold pyridoxal phosphate-dependent enzyme [Salinivirgaceae bacterium]|jgi:dTDP-4-amino-4,6-dideoxygalactose transaminase|nr:aminotransferase class I/II-fold pyridoxal phosphate-dependent enzyme [Salinivirgaceae bacterium]